MAGEKVLTTTNEVVCLPSQAVTLRSPELGWTQMRERERGERERGRKRREREKERGKRDGPIVKKMTKEETENSLSF